MGPGASFEEVLTFSKRFHTQAYMGMVRRSHHTSLAPLKYLTWDVCFVAQVEYRALLLAIHEITYGKKKGDETLSNLEP